MESICYIYPSDYISSITANLIVEYEANRAITYWENGTFATFSRIQNEMVSICYIYPCNYIPRIIANLIVEFEANWASTYCENP